MDKALFVGNPCQHGGWSAAAESHIKALSRKFDVAVAHVAMGNGQRAVDLPKHNLIDCKYNIQQVLPNLAIADRRFAKNIISYFSETNTLPYDWVRAINQFDCAVVPCEQNRAVAKQSGVTIPVHVIPIPLDTRKLFNYKSKEVHPIRANFPKDCIFYTIADSNPRKNINAILKAFYLEFVHTPDAQLVIKLPGNAEEANALLDPLSRALKEGFRIYPKVEDYRNEIRVAGYASEDELLSLHDCCDVFVTASRGESFSLPALTAFMMTKPCVAPKHTAFQEYLAEGAYFFNSHLVPCENANAPTGLHNAEDSWFEADHFDLRRAMRQVYNDWCANKSVPNKFGSLIKRLSYDSVSQQWAQILSS